MKNNIIYGSAFLIITIIGLIFFYLFYQTNYVNFDSNKIFISLNEEYWTNGDVTVKVDYDGNMDIKEYSFDGGQTWQKENYYIVKANEKLEIILKSSFNKKSSKIEYLVSNIDKEKPLIEVNDVIYTAVGKDFDILDYYEISDAESGLKSISVINDDIIDTQTIGDYDIELQATDIAGNTIFKTITVSVVSASNPNLSENQDRNIEVTGITVDKTKVNLVKGTKTKVNHTIKPSDATNKRVKWNSINPSVATVNSQGIITAISAGTTTITVTTVDNNKTSEINVVVTDKIVEVETITLDRKKDTVTTDTDIIVLTATIKPIKATNTDITWSSSNLSVATVKDGKVAIKGEGETTISAVASNGKIATYHLIVKDNYIFQSRKINTNGEVRGYQLVIYKNGVDITKNVTAITDPISLTKNSENRFEMTVRQYQILGDNVVIIYENKKHNVKRG